MELPVMQIVQVTYNSNVVTHLDLLPTDVLDLSNEWSWAICDLGQSIEDIVLSKGDPKWVVLFLVSVSHFTNYDFLGIVTD